MEAFEKVTLRRATGYTPEGTLRVDLNGLEWGTGNDKVTIPRDALSRLTWTPLHFGFQLEVQKPDGTVDNFTGLRHEALEKLKALELGEIHQEDFLTRGQNWGKLSVDGKSVVFGGAKEKPMFKIPLPDVSTVQYGKDDVTFEFGAVDVETGRDMLAGMSFHVPTENEDFPMPLPELEEGQEYPELSANPVAAPKELPAKRFYKLVLPHIDAAGKSERPVTRLRQGSLEGGRFEVQLHQSYLKMLGQALDFKIQYNSILHLFVLPKPNPAMTVVVMTLDPPIRKGQTLYNHVLFQFEMEAEMSLELTLSQEELDAKNAKHGGALKKEMKNVASTVFAACLKGLSGARLTRPRTFVNFANEGSCVSCSYKNDEGYLFPLERAFFYIHKPPLCITHDTIDSIEFQRQGTNVVSASVKTFDLCIRMQQGTEHQFRGIQRNEWQPLFNFIASKNLHVENVESVRQGPAQHVSSLPLEDMDLDLPHRSTNDSDESDPDFDMNPQDEEEEESDSSSSSGAEIVDEAEISDPEPLTEAEQDLAEEELPAPSPKKRDRESKSDEPEKKKKRKKKDKNAPKKNLSAFMFFSQAQRESVKQDNPGIAFGEVGKILGEKWKGLNDEERQPYQELAEKDKVRYQEEKAKYLATAPTPNPDNAAV